MSMGSNRASFSVMWWACTLQEHAVDMVWIVHGTLNIASDHDQPKVRTCPNKDEFEGKMDERDWSSRINCAMMLPLVRC